MFTLLVFLIILGLLVLSHEFGHFVVARRCGMKVYEFGFGFPPRFVGIQILKKKGSLKDSNPPTKWRLVWGRQRVEDLPEIDGYETDVVYSFNWLPLGGFVRIKGEEGQETGSDSFVSKPYYQKTLVLIAGVAMNVVLAAVLLSAGYMIGLPQALTDSDDSTVSNRQLQIMQVLNGKPAEKAGLKAGDAFIKIGELENPHLKEMQDYVNKNKDKEITVTIKRGQELIEKKIKPMVYEDTGKGGMGVAIAEVGIVKYPWHKAIYKGIEATGYYLKSIVIAFVIIIKGLVTGHGAGAAVSGPVGIAVMTGQVAKLGISYLINFTAILSLNLAIINILPIPALDGGRLVFITLGRIFRKKVPMRFEQIAHTLGFALLMLLVIVITVKDVGRFKGAFMGLVEKLF